MNEIKQLQYEVNEMADTLKELAVLEDGFGADYSEVITDVKWSHQQLKHRLQTLRNSVNRRCNDE